MQPGTGQFLGWELRLEIQEKKLYLRSNQTHFFVLNFWQIKTYLFRVEENFHST